MSDGCHGYQHQHGWSDSPHGKPGWLSLAKLTREQVKQAARWYATVGPDAPRAGVVILRPAFMYSVVGGAPW